MWPLPSDTIMYLLQIRPGTIFNFLTLCIGFIPYSVTHLRCNWHNDGFWDVWLVSEVGFMSWIIIMVWFWNWCQEIKWWNNELKKCGKKPDSLWHEIIKLLRKMFGGRAESVEFTYCASICNRTGLVDNWRGMS